MITLASRFSTISVSFFATHHNASSKLAADTGQWQLHSILEEQRQQMYAQRHAHTRMHTILEFNYSKHYTIRGGINQSNNSISQWTNDTAGTYFFSISVSFFATEAKKIIEHPKASILNLTHFEKTLNFVRLKTDIFATHSIQNRTFRQVEREGEKEGTT